MSRKTYLTILKIGICFSFVSLFLIFKNLLFPFITSKQIYFNILIEILFVFWAGLIIKYPEYRPFGSAQGGSRKNLITTGLVAFFAAMLISCFFSVDFNLSFWGDIERMLGWFHLAHFLIFYFIIITVMRGWKDWKIFFIISIFCASIVSLYGLANLHFSTIGNTAYVSGYLIFNIYFALLLFSKEDDKVLRWFYLPAILIILLEFKKAETTGAIVALGFSVMVLFFLLAVLNKNKKARNYTLAIFLLLVLFVGVLFSHRDSDLVRNNSILALSQQITFQKDTFQTRLISWRAAPKYFSQNKSRLLFGAGLGNYAIIFDKYFDPAFYNYTRVETYFDRAHNNLIDIFATTGAVGLLSYLSIFIFTAYYLIKLYGRDKIKLIEFSLLFCLGTAYFVQNLAVFDSLVTYISLMMTLGYVYWLNQKADEPEESAGIEDRGWDNKEIYSLVWIGAISLLIIYQFNIKPVKMLYGTIAGQVAFAKSDILKGVEEYKKALSYNTPIDRDSRDSLVRSIYSNYPGLAALDRAKAQEILDYAIEAAQKNIKYNPKDSLMQTQLAYILDAAARFNADNQKRFYYSGQAVEAIDKAIEASPGRINIYFVKAQIELSRGEREKAIEILKYAAGLNEKYYDSFCQLGKVYMLLGQVADSYKYFDQCLDKGGAAFLNSVDLVRLLLNNYTSLEDAERSIMLYERLTGLEKDNPKNWVDLAKLYAKAGDKEKAVEAAKKAAELDPGLESAVEEFVGALSTPSDAK